MICNSASQALVRRRRQHNWASASLFVLEVLDQLCIVRKTLGCDLSENCDLVFERSAARCQQARQASNFLACGKNRQKTLDQGVSLDKCTVEINANRLRQ